MDYQNYLDFAKSTAATAGQILLRYYQKSPETEIKGRNDIVTQADMESEKYTIDAIRQSYPDHKILSEETIKDEYDMDDFVWVIDPLDGTNNFSFGIPFFGTSIALWHAGEVRVGVVHIPILNQTFEAIRGKGAFLNGSTITARTNELDRVVLLTEITLRDLDNAHDTAKLVQKVFEHAATFKALGAAALDLAYVAKIAGACSLHTYFYPWDIAAGALIAEESGAKVTDFAGEPWTMYSDNCLAAHPTIHQTFLEALNG